MNPKTPIKPSFPIAMPNGQWHLPGLPPTSPAQSRTPDHPLKSELPALTLSAPALAALRWSARRSRDECCFWGILEAAPAGLRLREAVLAKHQGAPAYSIPDMEWYGDLVLERHEQEGLEPWQLACWIHTHPPGLCAPSGVDWATFKRHFGRQRLAVMLIMTQDLCFCGELSVNLPPINGLPAARLTSPLHIAFDNAQAEADPTQAAALERAYLERVQPLHLRSSPRLHLADWDFESLDPDDSHRLLQDEDDYAALLADEDDDEYDQWPRAETISPRHFSDAQLLAYLHQVSLETSAEPSSNTPNDLFDLERLAASLGCPEIRLRDAVRLRDRLRRLAQTYPPLIPDGGRP